MNRRKIAEPADAPNPAMAPWGEFEHHWRGVGDLIRWLRV